MIGSTELATYSNLLIYAAMLVLAAALISFAASFANGRRRVTPVATKVPAMAGAPAADDPSVGDGGAVVAADGDSAAVARGEVHSGRRAANVGMALTWLGFVLLLAGVVLRALWAGRVPWGNMYEFSITSAVGILAVFLGFSLRRDVRWLGLFIVFPVLLTLGLAVTVLYTEAAQLVPALKSYWLVIHVSAAVIGGGAFTIAAAITTVYLVRDAGERKGRTSRVLARFPEAARLEQMSYRILAFGFIVWTFAVVSGAIWAENAWGRYWGWDPKETWAFITWVVYAAYLHARTTAGWRGRKAAYVSLVGFACFLINYFGVNLFVQGLHSYSGL